MKTSESTASRARRASTTSPKTTRTTPGQAPVLPWITGLPSDRHVWARPYDGRSYYEGMTMNTADGRGRMTLRDAEKMAEVLVRQPGWAFERLYQDSANGTPVAFYKRKVVGSGGGRSRRYGEVTVDASVREGAFRTEVRFDAYKKTVAGTDLVKYMTRDGLAGPRPAAVLTSSAQLTPDGVLRDTRVAVELRGLPAIDTAKVAGIDDLVAAATEAIEGGMSRGTPAQQAGEELVAGFVGRLGHFLPAIVAAVIDDVDGSFSFTPKDGGYRLTGTVVDGAFSVTVDDLLAAPGSAGAVKVEVQGKVRPSPEARYPGEEAAYEVRFDVVRASLAEPVDIYPPRQESDPWRAEVDGQPVDVSRAAVLAALAMAGLQAVAEQV